MLASILRSTVILVAILVAVIMGLGESTGLFDGKDGGDTGVRRVVSRAPAEHTAATARPVDAPPLLSNGHNTVVFNAGPTGHYVIEAEVNGYPIRFLVDTGATIVALSPADAERVGLDVRNLDFNGRASTANGIARVADVLLEDIRIGDIEMRDVRAAVIESPMEISLLGMSFLRRLPGFEVRDKQLIMRW